MTNYKLLCCLFVSTLCCSVAYVCFVCFCSFTIFLAYIYVNKLCYYKNGLLVISPTVTNTLNHYSFYWNTPHMITLDINTFKHPWFGHCTPRNIVMFERRSRISKRFRSHSRALAVRLFMLLWYSFVTSWSWLGLWHHCWHRQCLGRVHYTDGDWDLFMECPLRSTFYFALFS